MNPFDKNRSMEDIIARHILEKPRNIQPKALFHWLRFHIRYQRLWFRKYKTASETLNTKKGCCLEQSLLYIVMSRLCDLETNMVYVEIDHNNREVNHACIMHNDLLIDTTYGIYGINHNKFRLLTDEEVIKDFKRYNAR